MVKGGATKLISNVEEEALKGVNMAVSGVTGTVGKFTRTIIENKGIAVGFMVGMATLQFIKSLVNDLLMPLLAPVISRTGKWNDLVVGETVGLKLKVGDLLSSFIIYFVTILATYMFIHALE